MRFKKYFVNTSIRAFFHLKNLGILVFVPLFILNILIPVINYLVYTKYGISDRFYTSILEYSQWFMPFASVWWPLLVLRDYIEGDGSELLYVNENRNKLADIFYLFIISIINISIIFSVYASLMPYMKYEYFRILSICVFYFGIVYALCFLTKSTTITLLPIILYTIANVYYGRGNNNSFFIYFSTKKLIRKDFISNYMPLLLIGIVLVVIGVIFNKKILKYRLYT